MVVWWLWWYALYGCVQKKKKQRPREFMCVVRVWTLRNRHHPSSSTQTACCLWYLCVTPRILWSGQVRGPSFEISLSLYLSSRTRPLFMYLVSIPLWVARTHLGMEQRSDLSLASSHKHAVCVLLEKNRWRAMMMIAVFCCPRPRRVLAAMFIYLNSREI